MRFLMAIHYPTFGGPHNQALRLRAPLAKRGWETIVLLPNEPGNAAGRLRTAGVPVVQMQLQRLRARPDPWLQLRFGLGFYGEVARIRQLIRKSGIDLVVVGGLVNPHAAIAARLEGVPVVWQLLDTRLPIVVRWAMMPLVRRLADVILTTGNRVAAGHSLVLGDRVIPYFPPVDVSLFRPSSARRAEAREELGLRPHDLVIGNVSNLNRQKGHRTFLSAAGRVHRDNPAVRFAILGATSDNHSRYATRLWDVAEKEGLRLGQELIVRDPGSRVADLAAALDIFWLTSEPRSEGIPTVVEEAMALGLPVVTVDVGGIREVVAHGVSGLVAPARRPDVIAEMTLPLLADAAIRKSLGEEARQWATANCDPEVCADTHVRAFGAAIAHHSLSASPLHRTQVGGKSNASEELVELMQLIVCPACRGGLTRSSDVITCRICTRQYAISDGIPILLLEQAASDHDDVDLRPHHKRQQAKFFNCEDAAEFEILRPHGTPDLYRWMLEEKFRRGITGLPPSVRGSIATALVVCGGSGMDAEFLGSTGARVITSDISIGAARRARERACRYGLTIAPIVADVEALPFPDKSVDLVYVHDGLHHLDEPAAGLREMARVAAHAVSVNEPARSAVTALAVHLGLALEREEAGNLVARMRPTEVGAVLISQGFRIVCAERYAMYYRHNPGRVSRLLSTRGLFPVAKAALAIASRAAGSVGNKLTVQAVRRGTPGVDSLVR